MLYIRSEEGADAQLSARYLNDPVEQGIEVQIYDTVHTGIHTGSTKSEEK